MRGGGCSLQGQASCIKSWPVRQRLTTGLSQFCYQMSVRRTHTRYLPPAIQFSFIADRFFVPLENRWLYTRYTYRRQFSPLHCWQIFRYVGEPLVVYLLLTAAIFSLFIADRFFVPLENRWLNTRNLPQQFSVFSLLTDFSFHWRSAGWIPSTYRSNFQSLHCWQIFCSVGEPLVEYPLLTAAIQSLHCWQIFRSVGELLVVYPLLTAAIQSLHC